MKRKCKKCGKLLDISNFYKVHNKQGNWFRHECKSCFNAITNENGRNIKRARVNENRKYALDKLGGKCYWCGEENPVKLHFHHVDPSKKMANISDLKQYTGTNGRIKLNKELLKCVILCQPCHVEAHRQLRANKLARGF